MNQCHEIKAVKHPIIIKKVSYISLVEELWRTPISDDCEGGAVSKKTKFFQIKYGGDITFIKQYEGRSE